MSALELPGGATKKQRITLSGGADRVTARIERFLHSHVQRSVSSRLLTNEERVMVNQFRMDFTRQV